MQHVERVQGGQALGHVVQDGARAGLGQRHVQRAQEVLQAAAGRQLQADQPADSQTQGVQLTLMVVSSRQISLQTGHPDTGGTVSTADSQTQGGTVSTADSQTQGGQLALQTARHRGDS